MFELRWVEMAACTCAEYNKKAGAYLCGCSRCDETERVLQYRTRLPEPGYITGTAFGGPWSDWRDVPIETEGGPE